MIKLQNILKKLHVGPHISMVFCTISGSFKNHAIVHVHCTSATCTIAAGSLKVEWPTKYTSWMTSSAICT